MTDEDPPPPKRRRKPPPGVETGYPDDTPAPPPLTAPRKPLWSEAQSIVASGEIETRDARGTPAAAVAPADAPREAPPEAPSVAPSEAHADASQVAQTETSAEASPMFEPQLAYAAAGPASGPVVATPSIPSELPVYTGGATAAPPATYLGGDGDDVLPPHAGADGADDLRAAVGARPKKQKKRRAPTPIPVATDDDVADDLDRPRSRKMIVVSVASLVVGLGVAALVFLGRANSAWFYLSCEPDKIVAERGRAFPPWGESTLDGKQWSAIKIPPEAECIPLETEDEDELAAHFRAMLVKRASVLLTAKEVTKVDEANALLEQALLHARTDTDPARNARTEIRRLLGDVAYWRASLRMRDAAKGLVDAAKQFEAAAQKRPRHVTDAAAWAEYIQRIVGELEAGPSGSTQTTFPPSPPPAEAPREPAPPGVALPVEPEQAGSAAEPPPPTPDAGLPTGGVLL